MKMLDFTPRNSIEKDIEVSRMIDEDIYFSCTGDLPQLRYRSSIPILIMDELGAHKDFSTVGLTPKEYVVKNYSCYTKNKFLAMRNTSKSDTFSQEFMVTLGYGSSKKLPGFESAAPLQVVGKLIEVTLPGVMKLDTYYSNGILSNRVLLTANIPVVGESKVFAYFQKSHKFFKYDAHEKRDVPVRGFTPEPAKSCNHMGTLKYSAAIRG